MRKRDDNGPWFKLNRLIDLGIGILAFLGLSGFIAWERIITAFSARAIKEFPLPQLSILLLLLTLILIFLWRAACKGELKMLEDNLKDFVTDVPRVSLPLTIGLAAFLFILVYFSNKIIIYSTFFVGFKLFEIWGLWIRNRNLKKTIRRACEQQKKEKKEEVPQAWEIVEIPQNLETIKEYYLEKPQVELAVTILFFSFISLLLALLGNLLETSFAHWLASASYVVMLLNIAINELIYIKWRGKRDDSLQEDYRFKYMF